MSELFAPTEVYVYLDFFLVNNYHNMKSISLTLMNEFYMDCLVLWRIISVI